MANRALVAKVERAASQRVMLAFDKFARSHPTNKAALRAQASTLVKQFTGAVTVGPRPVHAMERVRGGMVEGGSLLPANPQPRMKAVTVYGWEDYARQAKEAKIYIR